MTEFDKILKFLKEYDGEPLNIMEVCGTHTAAISENGIPAVLPKKINLISGPGCPVCVTVASYVDRLVELSLKKDTCVVTFGDMIRVKGSYMSLADARAKNGNVIMVYSPFDILEISKENPEKTYIFAAVGFETTTPIYAMLVKHIIENNIKNIKLLTALKTMPAVINAVCREGNKIDGFIAPGNVSVITGSKIYEPIAKKYNLPFVVSGFDGKELVETIYALVKLKGTPSVKNMYTQVVSENGNETAKREVEKYFMPYDSAWRGLGIIKNSGMVLRDEYSFLDASSRELTKDTESENGCRCKDVICGKIPPTKCGLFGKKCTPSSPCGACMVSTEGSCFNYFTNKRV